jgi:acyl carrier protein
LTEARIADGLERFIRRRFSVAAADARFTRSAPLFELGYIDSIGVVEVLAFIAKEWDAQIPDVDLLSEEFTTIDGMARVIHRLRRNSKPGH